MGEAEDAGSIYSEVRIKLASLYSDIAQVGTAFDNLGLTVDEKAEKYSEAAEKRYALALSKISSQTKNVTELVAQGALTEQEAVKKLIALKQKELKIIEERAVKEGVASTETIAAINSSRQAVDLLIRAQSTLKATQDTTGLTKNLDTVSARIAGVTTIFNAGAISEKNAITQLISLHQTKMRLMEQEAGVSGTVSQAAVEGIRAEQEQLNALKARLTDIRTEEEARVNTVWNQIPKIASNIFYIIRSIRLVKSVINDAIVAPLRNAEKAWEDQEQSAAKVIAVVNSTGASAWTSSDKILRLGESLAKVTKFSKDEVYSMEAVMLGFTRIQGVNFDEAVKAVLNVATVMKYDLTSSAQAVGKALEYPSKMLDGLRRQGFKFTDQQMAEIKALESAGKLQEAQKIVLSELSKAYGGTAEAVGATSSALKTMKDKSLKELSAAVGEAISNNGFLVRWRQAVKAIADEWTREIKEANKAKLQREASAIGKVQNTPVDLQGRLDKLKRDLAELEAQTKVHYDTFTGTRIPADTSQATKNLITATKAAIKEVEDLIEIENRASDAKASLLVDQPAIEVYKKAKDDAKAAYDATLLSIQATKALAVSDNELLKQRTDALKTYISALGDVAGKYAEFWGSDDQTFMNSLITKYKEDLSLFEGDDMIEQKAKKYAELVAEYESKLFEITYNSDISEAQRNSDKYDAIVDMIDALRKLNVEYGWLDEYQRKYLNSLKLEKQLIASSQPELDVKDKLSEIDKEYKSELGTALNRFLIDSDMQRYNESMASAASSRVKALTDLSAKYSSVWSSSYNTMLKTAIQNQADWDKKVEDGKVLVDKMKNMEEDRIKILDTYSNTLTTIAQKEKDLTVTTEKANELRVEAARAALESIYEWQNTFKMPDFDIEELKNKVLSIVTIADAKDLAKNIKEQYIQIMGVAAYSIDAQIEQLMLLRLRVSKTSDEYRMLTEMIDKLNSTKLDKLTAAFEGLPSQVPSQLIKEIQELEKAVKSVDFTGMSSAMLNGLTNTMLTPEETARFNAWINDNVAKLGEGVRDSFGNQDYDIQGYFKKYVLTGLTSWIRENGAHFTDEFKKVNHPTFSNESLNSNASTPGGEWGNENGQDTFTPSWFNIAQNGLEALKTYFATYEPGVKLILKYTDEEAKAILSKTNAINASMLSLVKDAKIKELGTAYINAYKASKEGADATVPQQIDYFTRLKNAATAGSESALGYQAAIDQLNADNVKDLNTAFNSAIGKQNVELDTLIASVEATIKSYKDMGKATEDLQKKLDTLKAERLKNTLKDVATTAFSTLAQILSSLSSMAQNSASAVTKAIDYELEKLQKSYGSTANNLQVMYDALMGMGAEEAAQSIQEQLTKKKAIENYSSLTLEELSYLRDQAIAMNDETTLAYINAAYDRVAAEKQAAVEKNKIEYSASLAAWKYSLADAWVTMAQGVLNAYLTKPFIPNGLAAGISAGVLGGLQIANIQKSKPVFYPVLDTGGVAVADAVRNTTVAVGKGTSEIMFGTSAMGNPLMDAFAQRVADKVSKTSTPSVIQLMVKEKVLAEVVVDVTGNGLVRRR